MRIFRIKAFTPVVVLSLACLGAAVPVSLASASVPSGVTGYTIAMGAVTTIPANSSGVSQVADAFCGNGKVVLSGGVVNHNSSMFIRTSYPTDSRTWQAVVTPTVNVGYPESFQTYAVCVDAASVPGYIQVQTPALPVGVNTYYGANKAVGDAYCSAGDVVVGGGVRSHNPSTFLTVSRPTTDQRAWEVEVHLTNPPSWGGEYYQVSAVCIPSADVSSYSINTATSATYGTGLTQAAPTNTAGSPYCGAGMLAVAGGATNHDQTNGFISSVAPNSSGKYWLVTDRNIAPPSYGEWFAPNSICVTGTF
ncbi:MAG: hypothetical protein ABI298_08820 [Acidimicrobiales bacterium]